MKTKKIFLVLLVLVLSAFPSLASDNIYWYMGGNQTNEAVYYNSIQIFGEINRIYTSCRGNVFPDMDIIRVFDLKTQNFIGAYNDIFHQYIEFSPGGKYYMLADGYFYECNTGKQLYNFDSVRKGYKEQTFNIAFSSNEKFFFEELTPETSYMFELQNGKYLVRVPNFSEDMGYKIDSNANLCMISDTGRFQKYNLVTGQKYIDTILYTEKFYDYYSGDSTAFMGDWRLSNSENYLLIDNQLVNNLKVYDLRNNKVIFDYNYQDAIIDGEHVSSNFGFSHDETCIINWFSSNGDVEFDSPVIFIKINTGDTVKIIKDIKYFPPIGLGGFNRQKLTGISHDNRYLYIEGLDDNLYDFYDLEKEEQHPVICNGGEILKTAFSHDNKTLFVYENTDGCERIQAYDVAMKKRVWLSPLISDANYNQNGMYYPFALSPNDNYIAINSDNYTVYLIPPLTYSTDNYILNFTDNTDPVTCLAFSDDEKYLASGNTAGVIYIWDIERKTLVYKIETNLAEIFAVKFSAVDEISIVTADGEQVYKMSTGTQVTKFANPLYLNLSKFDYYGYPNFPVTYSNDGNFCAYSYAKNGVNVYNTQTNDTIGLFDTGEVLMCAFSDDNKHLATCYNNENYIKIWDFQNKKEVVLKGPTVTQQVDETHVCNSCNERMSGG